jgi:hypothetical protein
MILSFLSFLWLGKRKESYPKLDCKECTEMINFIREEWSSLTDWFSIWAFFPFPSIIKSVE